MNALQRLLAATDLSAPARHAVERAALVARATGARLDLVHVAAYSRVDELRRLVAGLPEDVASRMREQTQMLVDALAAVVRERHGVEAATHVATGPLLQAIDAAAAAVDADLLVLGARGSSMLRHLVLGSTAARLIDVCTRPLLVVKRPAVAEYRCVLVPVDFSEASLPALRLARAVAPRARLVPMHAYEAPFEGKLRVASVEERYLEEYREQARVEAEAKMASLCDEAGLREGTYPMVVHGSAPERILALEDDEDCDLVVMGRQGQSRVEDLLLGSVSRRVLAEAEADVLVLP
ncbi:universal stress protein [Ramlibacter sp. USB13]|uniref:Universal stress protein n=1 Tax=Ramlibacter cellulosilyticus TaxID=2764187 RepID=A0A923SC60_9BURK|nr:universal stress protein [Ramlibacter cellulosilyticus]MBC5784600.1 universal stress protein [Ramlibacter cellulosilyticus]